MSGKTGIGCADTENIPGTPWTEWEYASLEKTAEPRLADGPKKSKTADFNLKIIDR